MKIKRLVLGPIETNCFILWNNPGSALIIDPCSEAEKIRKVIQEENLTIAAYLVTHGHADHISALADLHDEFPAPIGMHPRDLEWAFSPLNAIPPLLPAPRKPIAVERTYKEGQVLTDAGFAYTIMETPGHSPGSVSFYFKKQKLLASGDVLFRGSVGRMDLPGGDPSAMDSTLKKLMKLPDDTRVLCGHGPETTIGKERTSNPFVLHGVI